MDLTMVTSKRTSEIFFFTNPTIAKQSVVISCSKLLLDNTYSEFPKTVYTFKDKEGVVFDEITVTQILDSMIIDHVEHL